MPKLPHGYALEDGSQSVGAPGEELYGGATMNWALDGANVWYLLCCASKGGKDFKSRVFRLEGGALAEVPLPVTGTGRGWLDVVSNGYMYYAAWEGALTKPDSGPGLVPGAVPVPGSAAHIAALEARIAALEARAPVPGPQGPQGPQGVPGPQGPAGADGGSGALSARYTQALERLCAWLGIA